MSMPQDNVTTCNTQQDDQSQNEERALSVFSSEKNEDLTALSFALIVVFVVLMFTKWMV